MKKIGPLNILNSTECPTFMINSHISFLFRELNEIVKIIESRSNYDTNGYEMDLINNLKLIKNELQTERWIEEWNKEELLFKMYMATKIVEWQSMRSNMMKTLEIVEEMVENNDCYIATKVSRTFLKLGGKIFQGIANLMIV